MSWKTKLDNRLINDSIINDYVDEFKEYLEYAVNTFDVNINHLSTIKMVIQNTSALDKTNTTNELMIGLTALNNIVVVGDIVTWKNKDWIIVSKDNKVIDNCHKVLIQKSTSTLKFYPNQSSVLSEVPCIVGNNVNLGSSENNYMTLPDKKINVITPNTTSTIQIKEGRRFILGTNVYKVDSINDISPIGLLNIRMSWTEKNSNDNFTTKIADNSTLPPITGTTPGGGW
jgi:hypothetical protein